MGGVSTEPDMINRDPNNLNDNLSANFEEVFGEPEGLRSHDCAWKCGFDCYEGARKWCYFIITILCTWCAGLCWGCYYACMSCCMIWYVTPGLKCYRVCFGCCTGYFSQCIDCCYGTMFSAIGNMFTRIKVQQG